MGYGTTTDYWPAENVPTVTCRMHCTLDVCDQTGMLAGPYCPSHSTKGVIILPIGHPLYDFTATEYAGVLSDYLGSFTSLRMTGDSYTNNALLQSMACTVHAYQQPSVQADTSLTEDARTLLFSALSILNVTPAETPGYQELVTAYNALVQTLSGSFFTNEQLYGQMVTLTQAMANIGYY